MISIGDMLTESMYLCFFFGKNCSIYLPSCRCLKPVPLKTHFKSEKNTNPLQVWRIDFWTYAAFQARSVAQTDPWSNSIPNCFAAVCQTGCLVGAQRFYGKLLMMKPSSPFFRIWPFAMITNFGPELINERKNKSRDVDSNFMLCSSANMRNIEWPRINTSPPSSHFWTVQHRWLSTLLFEFFNCKLVDFYVFIFREPIFQFLGPIRPCWLVWQID